MVEFNHICVECLDAAVGLCELDAMVILQFVMLRAAVAGEQQKRAALVRPGFVQGALPHDSSGAVVQHATTSLVRSACLVPQHGHRGFRGSLFENNNL